MATGADTAPHSFQPPSASWVALAVALWGCDRRGGGVTRRSWLPPGHSTEPPSLPLQMDPVQKAVISHTFGVPAPLKKKQFISCNICHLRFNSAVSGARLGLGASGGLRARPWQGGSGTSGTSPTVGPSHPPVVLASTGALGCWSLRRSHPSPPVLDLQCLGLMPLCQQKLPGFWA